MNTKEILIAARAKIADPAHHTTEFYARDQSGRSVDVLSDEAVCWCALGALDAGSSVNCGNVDAAGLVLQQFALMMDRRGIAYVNDVLGHAAVIQMYDDAIDSCNNA